jgi:phage gp36-like protein
MAITPTPYAVVADLVLYGAPAGAFLNTSAPQQQAAIDAANQMADSYLGQKFTLPITSWGKDLTKQVVAIATYDAIVVRGSNPEAPGNANLQARWEAAIQWFRDIAGGRVTPVVVDSSAGGQQGPDFIRSLQTDPVTGTFTSVKPTSGRGW